MVSKTIIESFNIVFNNTGCLHDDPDIVDDIPRYIQPDKDRVQITLS